MANHGHDLIVIGASAGGIETLQKVLGRMTRLTCKPALEGEPIRARTVYAAVPDQAK